MYEKWYKDKELLSRHCIVSANAIELTATEEMDHDSLVTSQSMYAYDDDSRVVAH